MKLSTRLAIAMVTLVLLTASAIGYFTSRNIEGALLPGVLDRTEVHTRLLAVELETFLRGARADVLGFRTAVLVNGIIQARLAGGIHPIDGRSEADWRAVMASRFVDQLVSKPNYLQFRIIGVEDGGRELVRVERTSQDGAIRVVPDEELQRKADRPYFRDALQVRAGNVYVSPVELNEELGRIETPYVPVMRVAVSLQTPAGRPFGILVINLDMRPAFARIRSAVPRGGHVYVVNALGDFLVHDDPNREFGFVFGKPFTLHDEFPALAALLNDYEPGRGMLVDRAGERFGAALVPARMEGDFRIFLIQTLPYSLIVAPVETARLETLQAGLVALLGAVILAILLARSLTRPLVQMTQAVEAFEHGEPMAVPVAGGEIGVLARAFDHMATDVRDKAAALKRENAARRRIFDTSLDLILVTDRRGNFLQVSPSSMTILGYAPEEMTGRSGLDFICPDDLDHTRQIMRQARRGDAARNFETRYVRKDGRLVMLAWTGVWSEPEQQHFFFGRDMTERKAAEDALKQALVRHEAVFNSPLIGIFTLNESGTVETLNAAAAEIFQVSADAVLRRDVGRMIDLGGPSDITSAVQLRQMVSNADGVRELTARRRDGSTFLIDFLLAQMPLGERLMYVVFVRDITARKNHERMKDEFVATVSHELRTPLTSIAGSLGLMTGGAVGALPDAAKRLLTIAHTNSQRLVRLINDILDIEKLESGKMAFHLESVELRQLVVHAIDASRGYAEGFGVSIRLDGGAADGLVRVDVDRMTQVLTNLISNAVKFSPQGQEVVVSIVNSGTNIRVSVRDHGPGIPAEYTARVFEKFVQVDTTDARQKGGTGLGLSIVKQIVLRLGGDVSLLPAAGGGTIFHVDLPCWDQIERIETERLGVSGGTQVLLCEDDPDVAAVLAERLRAAGFPTDVAATAERAVIDASTRDYAAILVDLQLPDSDGISLIKRLRAQPNCHNTPIVVVSADPNRGREDKRASTLNILDWLAKPVDIERLVRVLNRPIVRDSCTRPRILHVDDDRDVRHLVADALGSTADIVAAETLDEARHLLEREHFDIAVLDIGLAEGSGLDLLPYLCGRDGQPIPVVVFSAQDTPQVAAHVRAVLTKSRTSINSLVGTLRRLVTNRFAQTKEVA